MSILDVVEKRKSLVFAKNQTTIPRSALCRLVSAQPERMLFVRKGRRSSRMVEKLRNYELRIMLTWWERIKVIRSRKMRWMGHWARMWELGNTVTPSVGKPGQKKSLETSNSRVVDIIQMDLKYGARLWAWSNQHCLGSSTRWWNFHHHPTRCTIFRVYWISLYMFRTVFPSIIRSPRLYTQRQICHRG